MSILGERGMPLCIAVCDDVAEHTEKICFLLDTYMTNHEIYYTISRFSLASDLLESDVSSLHLLFLDIRLGNEFGIDIGRQIAEINKNCLVIFVSSFSQYAPYGYEFKAFRYMLKDEMDKLMDKYLDAAMKELHVFRDVVTLSFVKLGEYSFFSHKLAMVESYHHKLIFKFMYNEFRQAHIWHHTIEDIMEKLPPNQFIRVQTSIVLNSKYIHSISGQDIRLVEQAKWLTNGFPIKISASMLKDVTDRFSYIKGLV